MTSTNDGYSCQNLQGQSVGLTTGKMLGGSSGNQHGIWVRSSGEIYDDWATIAADQSWNYQNLLPYFMKTENVNDEYIVAADGAYSGTDGPVNVQRQISDQNTPIMTAFEELNYLIVNNSNADVTSNIIVEPLLTIGERLRQSSVLSYLTDVKTRSNLYVLPGATVSKINFAGTRPLERATSVTFEYSGSTYTVATTNEIILTAGAIMTPQLLMLSGVGPSDHLTEMNIPVVADLPVGNNLRDHVSASLLVTLEEDSSTTPGANPYEFPVPVTCSYVNLTDRTSQRAEYQSINLVFPHDSAGLLQLCANVFKYSNDICDAMYAANVGRKVMWMVANVAETVSTGTVRLNTTSITDQPIVNLGLLSNNTDLVNLAKFLAHTASIVNTTYFQSIESDIVDLGLCSEETKYSDEYWLCYAVAMSSTMWHYSGTAALGSVVNSNLAVEGFANLRVADSSVMPTLPGGNIMAAVLAVAEKAADMIIATRGTCTTA